MEIVLVTFRRKMTLYRTRSEALPGWVSRVRMAISRLRSRRSGAVPPPYSRTGNRQYIPDVD